MKCDSSLRDMLYQIAEQYDRLRGTNVCQRGKSVDLMVDRATGRTQKERAEFEDFLRGIIRRMGKP